MLNRKTKYEFSAGTRVTHWVRAISIVVLTFTGLYIASPFISPEVSDEPVLFLNAEFRMWHQIAGFLLIAVTIYKSYLFLIDDISLKERISIKDFFSPSVWFAQIKYYIFIGEHPKLRGVYNPVQFTAYVGLYFLLFLICLTGLIMYAHNYSAGLGALIAPIMAPLEYWMGGTSMVRALHNVAMWGILIFIPVHIYMAIFNSIMGKEGSIDSIISGYKFEKKH